MNSDNLAQAQAIMKSGLNPKYRLQKPRAKTGELLIDKATLEGLYLRQHLTMEEIGKIYGVGRQRIQQIIKIYGIDCSKAERFVIVCDKCGKSKEVTRKNYRKRSTHYCSLECYLSDRKTTDYRPHRNGQREARRTMSKHIGRELLTSEVVHHIDGNCSNNSIDNLVLFPSAGAHLRAHHAIRIGKYLKEPEE